MLIVKYNMTNTKLQLAFLYVGTRNMELIKEIPISEEYTISEHRHIVVVIKSKL